MIDENELQELRKAFEMQFRYKFYREPQFPFLKSIGIKHVIQGFEHPHEEVGFVGILHLWWVPDPTGTVTDIWESEWLNTPYEGISLAQTLNQNRVFDVEKLVQTHTQAIQKTAEKEVMKQIQAKIRQQVEEESKNVLWN